MAIIALSGSRGFIGQPLQRALQERGHEVRALRRPGQNGASTANHAIDSGNAPTILFDPVGGKVDARALAECDAVIHLAGASVAQRWTPSVREAIMASRRDGTAALAAAIVKSGKNLPVVSASGIGLYGDAGEAWLDEQSPRGAGFLADVVEAWEAPWVNFPSSVSAVRLPMVVHPSGGALVPILRAVRWGVAGPVGNGQQWQSWIARSDAVGLFVWLVEQQLQGHDVPAQVNAVSAEVLRQRDFITVLAQAWRRPSFMPLPAFAVRLLFGAMGQELLLSSARVRSEVLPGLEWQLQWPALAPLAAAWVNGQASES
jgi:uncharacterized protein (TIGR01777 family)